MTSEDKTYCGRGEKHIAADLPESIQLLIEELGITKEDIMVAITLVGNDKTKVEEYFHNKENSY